MPIPDTLDARIRTLVTELIESAPQAPVLSQLEWEGHHHAVLGSSAPGASTGPGSHRPGTIRILLSTAVVLATVAGIAALVAVGPQSPQPAVLGRNHHPRPADQPPAAVSGNEQTIHSVSVPAFFTQARSSAANCWDVSGGAQALRVAGSPTFVSWTASPAPDPRCSASTTMAAVTYQGDDLKDGAGTDTFYGGAVGTVAGTSTAVLVVEEWPVSDQTLYVWNGLPTDAAYVTYSLRGTSLFWEQPLGGTAAVLVPQRLAQGSPDAFWPSNPPPVMTAYNASGAVLGTVKAPQVGDLHVGTSPASLG